VIICGAIININSNHVSVYSTLDDARAAFSCIDAPFRQFWRVVPYIRGRGTGTRKEMK
jgi:hypothetical protein